MTVGELAKKIGISRQWLNRLVDRREVPGVQRGSNGRLVICQGAQLDAWLGSIQAWAVSNKSLLRSVRRHMHDPKTLSFGRTAFLIETLFGLENDLVIHNACWDLPVREGLKILRSDPKFTSFKNFPLFEWVCSARTAKTRSLREDIALYSCNPGASEFRSLADIARKHGLTRSATSKAYRQMMSQNSGDLFNARGRSDKARKTMSVAALRSWQARRQAA